MSGIPAGFAMTVRTVPTQGEDGGVVSSVLLTTVANTVLMTPDQADAAGDTLKHMAARARAEAQAMLDPNDRALILRAPEGSA